MNDGRGNVMTTKANCSSAKGKSGQDSNASGEQQGDMKWWQLSLVGVGCTIGTGYFLGSTIGIKTTGPSIVFSFVLAALGTYIVYNLLAKMTAADPQEGSFVIMPIKHLDDGRALAVAGIIGPPIY